VGVSHLQVRRRGDFGVWRGVQKGEVTDRSRGSRETGELSFHMRARLNSIPFCEVSPGKSSGECDMAVYLSPPKNPAAFNCSNLSISISQTPSSFQGSTWSIIQRNSHQKTAMCNKNPPHPPKLISWDRKCRVPVQVPNSALGDNKRPAF
jgi:hypothetical protein